MNDDLINEWVEIQAAKEKSCLKSAYRHLDNKVVASDYEIDGKFRSDLYFSNNLRKHKFWPLIRIDQNRRRFSKNVSGKIEIRKKNRPIMYPSHRDSCIMSFYAFLLKKNYEEKIKNTILDSCILGYRKIPTSNKSKSNKSNIDFANDLFMTLKNLEDSIILCIDIKGFFDNINHAELKNAVHLFGKKIPKQNLNQIIKIVTKYHYIFAKDLEKVLGTASWVNPKLYNNTIRNTNFLHSNKKCYGIPQGTPISDIFSNLYLYKFDSLVAKRILGLHEGCTYRRYCDDILAIVPCEKAYEVYNFLKSEIQKYKLEIGVNKTEAFYVDAKTNSFVDVTDKFVNGYCRKKEFLQYLGFYMNLDRIIIRSSTVEKHYRKAKRIKGTRRDSDGNINKKPMDTYERAACNTIHNDSIKRQANNIKKHLKKIFIANNKKAHEKSKSNR